MENKANKRQTEEAESPKGNTAIDSSRRKATKLGLGAPVILALASRSVLGAGTANCQFSVQLSGNLSGHHADGDGTWLADGTAPEQCQDAPTTNP